MDLTHLVQSLRRHWLVAMFTFAVVFGIGIAAAFLPTKQYDATASILVEPNPKGDPSAAYETVQVGLPQTAAKVESRTFGEKVSRTLPAALRATDTTITTSTNPDSGVLEIHATSPNAAATAPIANAFAKKLVAVNADADADTALTQLSILDTAVQPTAPSSPVKGPILVGAFVLGLIAAVLAALLAASISRMRRKSEAFRNHTDANVLAVIPTAPAGVRGSGELWATVDPSKAPLLIESLQQLRANVEFAALHEPRGLVLAVTSAREGEGKSTIASNLAWMLASLGHQVLLVDADLRRPTLHRILGVPQGPGLAAAPAGDVEQLVEHTRKPRLSFIPSGVPDRHPAEVVSSGLPAVVNRYRSPDRIIIIDTPPLGSAAETPVACSVAGSALVVIDGHRHDTEEVDEVLAEVESRGAEVLGVVLNRVRPRLMPNRPSEGYIRSTVQVTNRSGAANGTAPNGTVGAAAQEAAERPSSGN